jgi:hypothetical protein
MSYAELGEAHGWVIATVVLDRILHHSVMHSIKG